MAWSTPPAFTAGEVVSEAKMDILSADLAYLLARPCSGVQRDNGATYTTNSTSFVDVDTTNVVATITLVGTVAEVSFDGVAFTNSGSVAVDFDFTVDGTRHGTAFADGLACIQSANAQHVGFHIPVTGLSAGSHTFKLQWKVSTTGTGNLCSGSGSGGSDFALNFWAKEIG